MPTFNYESHAAKLELRIMELEDTTAALIGITRTITQMLGNLSEIVDHYADTLGGMALRLPTTSHRLPMWPVAATSKADRIDHCNPLCDCADPLIPPNEPPNTP